MDRVGRITHKFLAYPTEENYERNELLIPDWFLTQHGDGMTKIVKVILRDGSKVMLVFDKNHKVLFGLQNIFTKNLFEVGCSVLFESFARGHFLAYLFDIQGSEIMNGCSSKLIDDSVLKFQGWCSIQGVTKFVFTVDCTSSLIDVVLPESFVGQFGPRLPYKIFMVLNNGQCFEGRFCDANRKLHCFCDVIHFIGCGKLTRLIVTYDGESMFYVSGFDRNGIERSLLHRELEYPEYKMSMEIDFEIEIKPSHLLKYCYGVYIHSKFCHLTVHWRTGLHIVVYHESCSWQIEVKRKKKKITLHNGWLAFSKDLNLKLGDVCFFLMRECYLQFDVEVVRKSEH